MSRGRVEIRRPVLYLAVAAVLALAAGFLPGTAPALPVVPADAPTSSPPSLPPCAPGTPAQDSLRPRGSALTGPTAERIRARGVVVAGVDQSKYLTGYRDPVNKELFGTDVEIANAVTGEIATALLGDPTKVRLVALDVNDRGRAITDGRVDLVVDDFTITCDRQRTVAFSAPYRAATSRILVERDSGITDIGQLAGKPVCTSDGSTHQRFLPTYRVHVDMVVEPGLQDCLAALQHAQVAAAVSDDGILAGLAAQDPQTQVAGGALVPPAHYGIGMPRGDDDLVRFVNGVLERLRTDGTLARSNRHWFGDIGHLDPVPAPDAAVYRD